MTAQPHLSLTALPPNGDQTALLLDVLDRHDAERRSRPSVLAAAPLRPADVAP